MNAETHPDPFQDAMGHGLQRAVQIASCAVTATQVYVYQQSAHARAAAEQDEQARRALAAQIRTDREAARATWTPALDPDWLRQADLFQAAATWGAALPYADQSVPWYEPAATTAMRECEERLRVLHPHAMSYYDRLRGDGMGPAMAMRETTPLFAHPPRAHDTPYTPRPALDAGHGENLNWAATSPTPDPRESASLATAEAQERRGTQIVEALQARARAQGRSPLGEAEQRTVLETVTNLPADVIDRVVHPDTAAVISRTEDAATTRANAATSQAAHPWKQDFPIPIQDVMAASPTNPMAERPASAASNPAQRPRRGDQPRP